MAHTILIVDDDFSDRIRIRELLSDFNAELILGVDGRDALELTADREPDLLIIDREMPFMSGIEASRVIHMSTPDLPILMISDTMSDELREHALNAGVSRIFSKPVDAKEIRFFVSRALGAAHERV